jgi:DNA-binding transcriptional MerR regulator
MDIKTISKITGLSAHTLRYYEKIGLLLNIERDSKGYRDYSGKHRGQVFILDRYYDKRL